MGWYIITDNVGKRYWTAHKNPLCGHLMKFKSKKCKLPKRLSFTHNIGVQVPCSACATLEYFNYQVDRFKDTWLAEHPEKLFGYKKLKTLGLI